MIFTAMNSDIHGGGNDATKSTKGENRCLVESLLNLCEYREGNSGEKKSSNCISFTLWREKILIQSLLQRRIIIIFNLQVFSVQIDL